VINVSEGTGRSTVRSQAIVMSAGRQVRQASKQTIKNEQCGSNPPKGMPQANSHSTWALASQGGYLWQFANCEQRYATYLPREIRTVPVRSEDDDTRLGDRGFLRARAGVTARTAGVVEGRRSIPIGGRWRFAGVGRDRPTTHARAYVASSLRCEFDRRLRTSTPAQAGLRMSAGEGAGCRGPRVRPDGVQARRSARDGGTVVGTGRRQLRPGLTNPAARRKPGRGSVMPRGCVPCGRLTPCLARVCELPARGYPMSSRSRTR